MRHASRVGISLIALFLSASLFAQPTNPAPPPSAKAADKRVPPLGKKTTENPAPSAPKVTENYNSVWVKTGEPHDAVLGWTREDLSKKDAELRPRGFQLVEVNAFFFPGKGVLYNGIWVKTSQEHQAVWGFRRADLATKEQDLFSKGFQILRVNALWQFPGGELYNAVWAKSTSEHRSAIAVTRADFEKQNTQLQDWGYRLIDLNAFHRFSGVFFNAVWEKSNDDRPWVLGWSRADFDKRDAELRQKGYTLLDVNAFNSKSEILYNAIWTRSASEHRALWGWSRQDFERFGSEQRAQNFRPARINVLVR